MAVAAAILTCLALTAVDGDTIKCDGQNMRIMGAGAPNVSGVDTPEIRTSECAKEKLLGHQAKIRLEELLRSPGLQIEDSGVRDRYGRPLVWVRLRAGSTAGETLITEGYAVRWEPGYRADWCS